MNPYEQRLIPGSGSSSEVRRRASDFPSSRKEGELALVGGSVSGRGSSALTENRSKISNSKLQVNLKSQNRNSKRTQLLKPPLPAAANDLSVAKPLADARGFADAGGLTPAGGKVSEVNLTVSVTNIITQYKTLGALM
jgi:hypothetical protein